MNQRALPKIILSFFIILPLPTYNMMKILKKLSSKSVENAIVYRAGTRLIDVLVAGMSRFTIWLTHITHRKKRKPINYESFEKATQQKLKNFENSLLTREKQLIDAMYDDYNINPKQRNAINSIIDQSKEYEKKYMSQPHAEATHDLEFPPHITELCATNNIHPNSIKTAIESTSRENVIASAGGIKLTATITDDNIVRVQNIVAPPTIYFFQSFFACRKVNQDNIWGHEARHLICQHSIIKTILLNCITEVTKVSWEEIECSKNYQLLKIEHERQAEILCNNAQLASLTRNSRRNAYYPDTLFLNHYADLAIIDELYKFPDNLRTYKPIPLQKIKIPTRSRWETIKAQNSGHRC